MLRDKVPNFRGIFFVYRDRIQVLPNRLVLWSFLTNYGDYYCTSNNVL